MTITGRTLVAGIVGQPVAQSMSPVLHNAWLADAGIDGVYVPFSPPLERFAEFISGIRHSGVSGLNVTIPFKEEALALADEASDRARAAGAANVLTFSHGSCRADNTDGAGLTEALKIQAPALDLKAGPSLVYGAGGAARGAVAALLAAGAPEVRIINRTRERAEAIAGALPGAVVCEAGREGLAEAVLAVNATSLGMNGGPGPQIDLDRLAVSAVVMDMVFKPLRTELLKAAAGRRLTTVDGLEMLIRHAVPSFEAFFGAPPPAKTDVRGLALGILGETR